VVFLQAENNLKTSFRTTLLYIYLDSMSNKELHQKGQWNESIKGYLRNYVGN
jgi:hypothetical protein